MMRKISERALYRWKEILLALGVESATLSVKHGPCPVCGGKDRFRFDDKYGKGTWFCSQQHGSASSNSSGSAGNGFALVMDLKRCDFPEAARLVEKIIGSYSEPASPPSPLAADDGNTYAEVKALWREAKPITADDPAGKYLIRRLGRLVPSQALRFHPSIPRGVRTHPGMLSAFVDVHGDLSGLQRTFLLQDGRKVNRGEARLTMGTLPAGGAVRLERPSSFLGIAEGVETALSASIMHRIPCWAALNEGRLQTWEPPDGVTNVVVFGDSDQKYAGQFAAYALAKRLETRPENKIITQVVLPLEVGTDWNDVHRRQREEALL